MRRDFKEKSSIPRGLPRGGSFPAKADIPGANYLGDTAISVQTMLVELNDAGNELNVVVLDACRDFPAAWSRSMNRGLTVVTNQPADSIVVYATSAGSTAVDGTGRNGLFTGQLLKNLAIHDLDVSEVFRRTGADVSQVSKRQQIPAVYNQFFGIAYLGQQVAQPVAIVPVQPVPLVPQQPAPKPIPAPKPPRMADTKVKGLYFEIGPGAIYWVDKPKNYDHIKINVTMVYFRLHFAGLFVPLPELPIISAGSLWVIFAFSVRYSAVILSMRTIGIRIRAFEGQLSADYCYNIHQEQKFLLQLCCLC